jgi:hypothetical protein
MFQRFDESPDGESYAFPRFVPTSTTVVYAARAVIVDFVIRTRLPATFGFRESVELGSFMSYWTEPG